MWTKTVPTVPGFYWWRAGDEDIQVVQRCETSNTDGWQILGAEWTFDDESMLHENGEFWSDLLQVPE